MADRPIVMSNAAGMFGDMQVRRVDDYATEQHRCAVCLPACLPTRMMIELKIKQPRLGTTGRS
ncbi:hypothetical protein [Massilia psychrophila]|uniref:Uncharacterized protein n=1 Tax=Massilia psychrophila TaxID=1603353 RepID=A0A2G8T2J7_9BURK|nr:hypothetical protein [Massilia psychrophila]PIL39908.1 hypothetical protein CR103_10470 [Massilia psychrophila]